MRILVTALIAVPATAAEPSPTSEDRVSLAQVATGLERSHGGDAEARALVRTYLNAVVEGAVSASKAAPSPLICARPGQGRFDGEAFLRFARSKARGKAAEAETAAAPLIVEHLMRTNPCSRRR